MLSSRPYIKLQNKKLESIGTIIKIISDHGKEFKNLEFNSFCDDMGIQHDFSTPKPSWYNGCWEKE